MAVIGTLVVLLAVVHVIPFLLRRDDMFSPVYATLIFFGIAFPARAAMYIFWPDDVVGIFPPPVENAMMTQALLWSTVGMCAYLFGYYSCPKVALRPGVRFTLRQPSPGIAGRVLILYLFGWTVRLYQILTGSLLTFLIGDNVRTDIVTPLAYLADTTIIAYVAVWALVFEGRPQRSRFLLAVVITIIETAYDVLVGGAKLPLLQVLFFPIMAYQLMLLAQRRPLRLDRLAVALAAGMLASVFVVFPYIGAYRDAYISNVGTNAVVDLGDNRKIAAIAARELSDNNATEDNRIGDRVQAVVNRQHGLDSLLLAMSTIPSVYPYAYGVELLNVPLTLVPRIVWPNKPSFTAGDYFSNAVVGGDTKLGSTGLFGIADGYLNFGVIGIPLIMWLVGTIQRVVYDGWYKAHAPNIIAVSFYLYLLPQLLAPGFYIIAALVQRGVVMFFIYRFLASGAGGLFSRSREVSRNSVSAMPAHGLRV